MPLDDTRYQYNEIAIGANDSQADSVNRLALVSLAQDGRLKPEACLKRFANLVIKNQAASPATTLEVSADYLIVEWAAQNGLYYLSSVSFNIVMPTDLDTGSEAANTTYALWAIYNKTSDTTKGLLSTSFTAPTMPSGYDYKTLIGFVRNDSGSDFIVFCQQDTLLVYDAPEDDTKVLNAQSDTSFTDVDCTNFAGASSICKIAILGWYADANGVSGELFARPNGSGATNGRIVGKMVQNGANNSGGSGEFQINLDSSLKLEYKVSDVDIDATLTVNGCILSIW